MKLTPALTLTALLELIENGRNAELCRDSVTLRKLLEPVWADIEETPDYEDFELEIHAELLRLSGVMLTFYGLARNLKNYQLRGKDLFTNAIDLFKALDISEKVAETRINLSYCYWNLGETREAEIILEVVEEQFGKNLFHPVYLQICINKLLVHFSDREIKKGLELIRSIETPITFCPDLRLKGMFHSQAGLFYRADHQYQTAVFHFNEAIRFAHKTKNPTYIGVNYNNLAFLYKEIGQSAKALEHNFASVSKFKEIEHFGFLAHALDTRALIHLDRQLPQNALEDINEALEIFCRGEDYRGWTEALWTKYTILKVLGRTREAQIEFAELIHVAREKIGVSKAEKFIERAERQTNSLPGGSYKDKVKAFKKSLVSEALIAANGVRGKASRMLGFKDHRGLSEILTDQFPELIEELGFKRRAKRGSRKKSAKIEPVEVVGTEPREITLEPKNIFVETSISKMSLDGKSVRYDFAKPVHVEHYYFDHSEMEIFGVDDGAVVAVAPVQALKPGLPIVVELKGTLISGVLEHWTYFYIVHETYGAVILDDVKVIGVIAGYCALDDTDDDVVRFTPLAIT